MSGDGPGRQQARQGRERLALGHVVVLLLAWLLALALLQRAARLPDGAELAWLLAVAATLLLVGQALRKAWPRALCWALGLGLLAYAQAAWRAERVLAQALPPAWEGRDLLLTGRIASMPQALVGQGGLPGWRFEFELEQAQDAAPGQGSARLPPLPPRLLLSAYAEPGVRSVDWRAGERWRLLARLRRPSGLLNPHGYDQEFALFEQGLRATGVLRPGGAIERLTPASFWRLERWRQVLRERIQREVDDPARAGVLAALSLGDQAAISREGWALFRATGVSHLLSVSGLHVTMFAWGAASLVAALWRRSARLCLRLPAPRAGLWAGVLAAAGYAMFSGWGVPAQRTLWMLVLLALLRESGLRWPWPLALLASAVLVTLLDPLAPGQAGFWLSFAAVGLLMASGEPPPRGLLGQLRAGLHSQWAATLGLAPLTLLFFQQLSVVGLLANLLAIPLVSLVITPLALAGALVPALWHAAAWCVGALDLYLAALAALPGAVWHVAVAPLWAQALGLLGAAWVVLPLPWRVRAWGGAMLLPLLWPALQLPAPGRYELLAADIGQGTAVLLRTARHSLLFDAGPQYAPGSDAGSRVLLPLLHALGVGELDLLVLSHRDQDHVGGAAPLLAGLPVRGLLSSLAEGHVLRAGGPPHRRCLPGLAWDWDGVHFELLHPDGPDYERATRPNTLSCVLRVSDAQGWQVALLTADIEAAQEQALLARGAALRAEVLMLPHHGSKTSSTPAFLDAVAPRLVFAQAGYRNRFGHPAPEVLARLHERGIAPILSADCGAWRWRSGEAQGRCERETSRRFWHRPVWVDALAQQQAPEGPAEPDQLF